MAGPHYEASEGQKVSFRIMKYLSTNRWIKNKDGQTVFFQPPNAPILIWFGLTVIKPLLPENTMFYQIVTVVAFGALFTWAWLEISSGVTYLRRLLGGIVMVVSVITFANTL